MRIFRLVWLIELTTQVTNELIVFDLNSIRLFVITNLNINEDEMRYFIVLKVIKTSLILIDFDFFK